MSVDESKIQSVFFAALERSPAEREIFLEDACASDVQLRQRVDELLSAKSKVGDFLNADTSIESLIAPVITEAVDSVIGSYKLREILGEGGMGTVYAAEQEKPVRRKVALKVIKPGMDSREVIARFEAERQALALMDHPNIAKVLEAGTTQSGRPYFVMEYVDGLDLFEYLKKRNRLPVKRSIEIIKQVAAALQHAYEQNIVHRDIKPSNLLLKRDGTVKITDLGLARSIDDTIETNITRAGTTVGTVDYMAPEQARNSKSADTRSDIYSLGCTWYQMLTGQPPFPEGSLTNKLTFHSIKPLPDPRDLNDQVPEGLLAVLHRMTAKKPEDRYQTPAELLDDINRSTLTKNAFSREIFDDLDEEEGVPNRRRRSSHDNEDEEEAAENDDVRMLNDDEQDEDEDDAPVRRKSRPRSRVEEEDDQDDDDVPLRKRNRPRGRITDEDQDDEDDGHVRKRSRHRPEESESDSDQPSRSGKAKKKASPNSRDEDSDDSVPQKRKRRGEEEGDEDAPRGKASKQNASKLPADPRAAKPGGKMLPPKREAIVPESEKRSFLNADAAKGFGFIAAIAAVVCGVGWLIFRTEPQNNRSDASPVKIGPPQAEVAQKTEPPVVQESPAAPATTPNVPDRSAAEFDITQQPIPAWATAEPALPADLPKFTVGPGSNSTTHFSDINEAIQAAEKTGGVIRLSGIGPYFLSSHDLQDARKLIITSANDNETPLVIIRPTEVTTSVLAVTNCELILKNVHFVFNQSANPTHQLDSIVSVTDGKLFVRRCSFTALSVEGSKLAAIDFNSQQDSTVTTALESQVLLDQVVVRGNGLSALRLHRTAVDAIIQDSLLVTGTAPAISLSGQLIAGLADAVQRVPRRMIRVLRSTICVRKLAFDLIAETAAKPPLTAIYFADSVCSVEGTNAETVLVSAVKWPVVSNTEKAGWLTNLSWASTSTLYTGFELLLDIKLSFKVDASSWQRVMGLGKMDPNQFQSIVWPENPLPNLGAALPADFDNSKLPYRDIKTSSGGLPGCAVGKVSVPEVISQQRLFAMSQRLTLPSAVNRPVEMKYSKKVDLVKEDLGQIINKGDWTSGTVFEAVGSGNRFVTPVRIVDKSCRIIFYNSDPHKSLTIQPKIDPKLKADIPAMFSVENGTLELHSASVEMPFPRTAAPWLISSINSTVIVRDCLFSGPLTDSDQHPGLIRWSTVAVSQAIQSAAEQPYLAIKDSVLVSTGTGIQADCSHGNVFVRNSILGIRGTGIRLRATRSESPFLPTVDLDNVTVSASKSAIQIDEFAGAATLRSVVRLFVDECAFVTPLAFKEGESDDSTVVEFVGAPLDRTQIEWWGNSNGFSSDIRSWLRQPNTNPINDLPGWQKAWGEPSDIRLLSGTKGVDLLKILPTKWTNMKSSSFALDPGSPAATWADGKQPIGADVAAVDAAIAPKKYSKPNTPSSPSPANTKKANPTPTRPMPNQSGF